MQLLTFKRCLRFFEKLDDPNSEERFVGKIKKGILDLPLHEKNLLGPNMFTFWPEFVESCAAEDLCVSKLYSMFNASV